MTESPISTDRTAVVHDESETAALARLNPPALNVSQPEIAFARHLSPLIHTPRAGKRLFNLYRLARAALPEAGLESLVSDGEYQGLMLALAIIVGSPTRAFTLFSDAMKADDQEDWATFLKRLTPHDQVIAAVETLLPRLTDLQTVGSLTRWIPLAARFSFHTGELAATLRE